MGVLKGLDAVQIYVFLVCGGRHRKGSVAVGLELGSEGWREMVCVRGARLQPGVFWGDRSVAALQGLL